MTFEETLKYHMSGPHHEVNTYIFLSKKKKNNKKENKTSFSPQFYANFPIDQALTPSDTVCLSLFFFFVVIRLCQLNNEYHPGVLFFFFLTSIASFLPYNIFTLHYICFFFRIVGISDSSLSPLSIHPIDARAHQLNMKR